MTDPICPPYLGDFIVLVGNTKRAMLAVGHPDGVFDCPKCGAQVLVRLVGRKNHVRARCATGDCLSLIE